MKRFSPYSRCLMGCLAAGVLLAASVPAAAQASAPPPPLVKENAAEKISDHVYVIPDESVLYVPNVGIIVGSKATLVVDTGLGTRNGQTVAREAARLGKNSELYVVCTHFHPEHAAGAGGFPANAKLIRPQDQQKDIDELGEQIIENFRGRTAINRELLTDPEFRRADIVFDRERELDLGGVKVRMMVVGPTHTRGDTVIFVEQDRVLFSGDVAMKYAFPAFATPQSSGKVWLASLDRLGQLKPLKVIPSHGPMGDASLISGYSDYLKALQQRVTELKAQGKSSEEIGKTLQPEFEAKFPNFTAGSRVPQAAAIFYKETP